MRAVNSKKVILISHFFAQLNRKRFYLVRKIFMSNYQQPKINFNYQSNQSNQVPAPKIQRKYDLILEISNIN